MNKNTVLKMMLGIAFAQSLDLLADEKLNLYERNLMKEKWQQEQNDYYPQNDYYHRRYSDQQADDQPYGQDDYNRNTYQQRGHHKTIGEPPQPPPEC